MRDRPRRSTKQLRTLERQKSTDASHSRPASHRWAPHKLADPKPPTNGKCQHATRTAAWAPIGQHRTARPGSCSRELSPRRPDHQAETDRARARAKAPCSFTDLQQFRAPDCAKIPKSMPTEGCLGGAKPSQAANETPRGNGARPRSIPRASSTALGL